MPASLPIRVPEVLLPGRSVDPSRWAVIACDQFTAQPDYWAEVERVVGEAPSTLRMVLPEVYLGSPDVAARIASCHAHMADYLERGLLEAHRSIVSVERETSGGVQRGLVVELDLETYDFTASGRTPVRATEGTVVDRVPPRLAVRRGAPLEVPHILVLYDDPDGSVLAALGDPADLPLAYEASLMLGSGHVTGRFVPTPAQEGVLDALARLGQPDAYRARYGLDADEVLLFAMGDGNHSLATAKVAWDELVAAGAGPDHPARWALVELVNLHDPALSFEPIHRVVFAAGGLTDALTAALDPTHTPMADLDALLTAVQDGDGSGFGVITADGYTLVEPRRPTHQLAVGTLQSFLDAWLADHPDAEIDYLHGEDITDELGRRLGNVSFVLPGIAKGSFFRSIAVDGPLPRKTFSMGHARDKRFYLECRRITES